MKNKKLNLLKKKALVLGSVIIMATSMTGCKENDTEARYAIIQSEGNAIIMEYKGKSFDYVKQAITLKNGDVIYTYSNNVYYIEGSNAKEDAYSLANSLLGENGEIIEYNQKELTLTR